MIGIDEVFEARTARGAAAETAARTSRLSASDSGAASRTTSRRGEVVERRRRRAAARAPRRRPRRVRRPRSTPRRSAPRRRARCRSRAPAGSGSCSSVVAARVRAGELGQARAHGPGADDADDHRAPAGTSALMPVTDAADDELLDLRGALVERRHARVAEEALDRDGRRRSPSRRGPGSPVRAPDRGLGREELGDRRLGRRRAPGVLQRARALHEQPGGVGADDHVGEHLLHELEGRDRPLEGLALLGVLHRLLHRSPGRSRRSRPRRE